MSTNTNGLGEQFVKICRLMHMSQHRSHQRHGPMADPHRGQGRVLALLKMRPEISQKDLSYLLDIRPQSLGELLAKLERSGYITRTASEEDNRVMNITLTEEGSAVTEQQTEDDPGLFADLTEEEQGTLSEYLTRVIENMEKVLGGQGHEHGPHHGPHPHHPHAHPGHLPPEPPHGHPQHRGHGPHAHMERNGRGCGGRHGHPHHSHHGRGNAASEMPFDGE